MSIKRIHVLERAKNVRINNIVPKISLGPVGKKEEVNIFSVITASIQRVSSIDNINP